jgi:hypothetical protein
MGDTPLIALSIGNNFGKSKEKTMNSMKRLFFAISLTIVLAVTALAGEMNAPPCPNPGEMNAPPCTDNQLLSDEPADQNAASSGTVETLTIETAISAIENLLTIY